MPKTKMRDENRPGRSPRLRMAVLPIAVGVIAFVGARWWMTPPVPASGVDDAILPKSPPDVVSAMRSLASLAATGSSDAPADQDQGRDLGAEVTRVSDQSYDAEWESVPRATRSLARLFAFGPLAAKSDYLVRHVDLNPGDRKLTSQQMHDLRELLDHHMTLIEATIKEFGLKRHGILVRLERESRLQEVTPDSLLQADKDALDRNVARQLIAQGDSSAMAKRIAEWRTLFPSLGRIVPQASAVMMKDNQMLVATSDQLLELDLDSEYIALLKATFLYETLHWFLAQGLTHEHRVAQIVEEFHGLL